MHTRSIVAVGVLSLATFGLGAWASQRWGASLFGGAEDSAGGMSMGPSMQAESGKKVLYWKSSMVAGEIHQEPGKDSMGMDLVPVYEGEGSGPGQIEIDPATQQNMGVRLGKVTKGPLVETVRTVGYVDYDETTLGVVTTKVDGWIEKLHVEETGAQVHAGDPLFEIYSPALFSAQEEYLVALKSLQTTDVSIVPRAKLDSESLLQDARTRLEYFDVPQEVIEELERTRVAKKTLTLRSAFTGIVTHKNVVEGQKVMAGHDLLRIADLSRVWVLGRVYEYDLPYVRVGQDARMTLSYLPGKTFLGKVTYVYPYLKEGTREISVRMEFFNPGYELKPGMYSTIHLRTEIDPEATLVPDVAVIDTGERSVVFVAKGSGRFELRDVRTGLRSEGDRIQVLSGLTPGEEIVLSGQFLLDSESRLREAALKFLDPGGDDSTSPTAHEMQQTEMQHIADADSDMPAMAPQQYVCPMPEHQSVLYEAPGDCPICGDSMQLVPAAQDRASQERSDR